MWRRKSLGRLPLLPAHLLQPPKIFLPQAEFLQEDQHPAEIRSSLQVQQSLDVLAHQFHRLETRQLTLLLPIRGQIALLALLAHAQQLVTEVHDSAQETVQRQVLLWGLEIVQLEAAVSRH